MHTAANVSLWFMTTLGKEKAEQVHGSAACAMTSSNPETEATAPSVPDTPGPAAL